MQSNESFFNRLGIRWTETVADESSECGVTITDLPTPVIIRNDREVSEMFFSLVSQ
jgi:hypothetical protein